MASRGLSNGTGNIRGNDARYEEDSRHRTWLRWPSPGRRVWQDSPVIGFDINHGRIDALREGRDATLEVSGDELREADAFRSPPIRPIWPRRTSISSPCQRPLTRTSVPT